MNEQEKQYFQALEKGIENVSEEQRGNIYRMCAINCVKSYVLPQYIKIAKECHDDLDLMFSREATDYVFQKVIEKGHIYEMGYPQCLCFMHESGFAQSPVHCECSRQSILYLLHELFPQKKYTVEIINTVLNGADKCTFRIITSE